MPHRKAIIKRLQKALEDASTKANHYGNFIVHLVQSEEKITVKVFDLAMRRAGCKNLSDATTLNYLYQELAKFTEQVQKRVPDLVVEAEDEGAINSRAWEYARCHAATDAAAKTTSSLKSPPQPTASSG